MKEVFRRIKYLGFESYYVSNYGRVRNSKGKFIKGYIGPNGKRRHTFTNKELILTKCTHIVVLEHFRKNELGLTCGLHLDGKVLNNKSRNLKWASKGELISQKRLEIEKAKGRIPGVTDMRNYSRTIRGHKPFRAMLSERLKNSNKYKAITLGYFSTKKEAAEAYYFAYLSKFGVEPFSQTFLNNIK